MLADKKYKAAAATLLKALQLEPEDDVVVREHEEAVSKAKAAQLQSAWGTCTAWCMPCCSIAKGSSVSSASSTCSRGSPERMRLRREGLQGIIRLSF